MAKKTEQKEKIVGTLENPNYNTSYIPDAFGVTADEFTQKLDSSANTMYQILETQQENLEATKQLVDLIRNSEDMVSVGLVNLLIGHVNELYETKSALSNIIIKTVRPWFRQELGALNHQIMQMNDMVAALVTNTNKKDSGIIVP